MSESKLEIARKEASETGYWLELLYRTKYIDEHTFKSLLTKCTSDNAHRFLQNRKGRT
ncbi:MAG: four helix bundle protein [Christensenellaceae bacterium]|nr:four helix bundle protein [Christensenellaceae bacterium]